MESLHAQRKNEHLIIAEKKPISKLTNTIPLMKFN